MNQKRRLLKPIKNEVGRGQFRHFLAKSQTMQRNDDGSKNID